LDRQQPRILTRRSAKQPARFAPDAPMRAGYMYNFTNDFSDKSRRFGVKFLDQIIFMSGYR
jgi:hypothetical protein